MRCFYVFLAAFAVVAPAALMIYLFLWHRLRRARNKVYSLSAEEKAGRLNAALDPFGFCYEEGDDSISSGMYPWQRQMGYCKAYDEAAMAMNIVIDCEPIYFNCGSRRYLLELWKGQYGCATGAEIGIYVNRDRDFEKPAEELFYECVEDAERLFLNFTLIKNGEVILRRNALHWWLTGFLAGMYAEPEELTLKAEISFPNLRMCSAFYEGLLRAGYGRKEIRVEGYTVIFSFEKPHIGQTMNKRRYDKQRLHILYRTWIRKQNQYTCSMYGKLTKNFDTTLNRITFLGYSFPVLYRMLIHLGIKRRYFQNRRRRG